MRVLSSRTALGVFVAVATLSAGPAWAGPEKSRGDVLNADWRTYEVEIKDPQGRTKIWKVAHDATVKFSTEDAFQHRNAKLTDVRPGMYIHFVFEGTNAVIQEIDVKEATGASGASSGSGSSGSVPAAGAFTGRVTAVDLRVAQVEVMLDRGGRKTFQAANAGVLSGLQAGDQVSLVTESRGGQDVVVQAKRQGSSTHRR
jgi:hypothetical protein